MQHDKPLARSTTVTDHTRRVTKEKVHGKYVERELITKEINVINGNEDLYSQLWQTVTDPSRESIFAMENHAVLLQRFLLARCQHFSKLSEAIAVLTEDKILVHVTEIHLYGVFSVDNYVDFVRSLYERSEQPASYTPKQVSLSGFPQRVVFMCNGSDQLTDVIVRYCELHFKSKVNVNRNGDKIDIVLQSPIVKNLEEARQMYEDFVKYVNTRERVEKFGMYQNITRENGTEFVVSSMGDHSEITDVASMLRFLNAHPGPITLNINAHNVIIGNNNIIQQKDQSKSDARIWVRNNPPKNRETKCEYHTRYIGSNPGGITERILSKIVAATAKCETLRSNGVTYWIYK
jgi:hypothetical protein